MNKYRKVEYADDGCYRYECLSCHKQWEVRYAPTTYCGHCGIKFDGQHMCRTHHTPRWVHERFNGNHPRDEREDQEEEKIWMIQKRKVYVDSYPKEARSNEDWSDYCKSGGSAAKVLYSVKNLRLIEEAESLKRLDCWKETAWASETYSYEYRIVIRQRKILRRQGA